MRIERGEHRISLIFEHSPGQQAMGGLYLIFTAGFGVALLLGCVYAIFVTPARALEIVPLFLGCAALAAMNCTSAVRDRDCATLFDLKARTVTCMESGVISRQRGPVSFDEVVGLRTRVGFASSHRSVIAELILASGEEWRVGYELIFLRPTSSSDVPRLVAQVRKATGLDGDHTE